MPSSSRPQVPRWRSVVLWALRGVIGLGCLVIAVELAIHAYPPLLPWGLAIVGRSPVCPHTAVLAGARQGMLRPPVEKQLRAESRLVEEGAELQLWATPAGPFWVPKGSAQALPTLLAQQETRIYGGPDRGVRPGDAVIDCGAHVGVYVRTALDAGAKIVVAVEPAPHNIESLRRNFPEEIAAGQVVVYPKGVWDREETLPLYSDPANSAGDSFIIQGRNDVVTANIQLTTIDKRIDELGLPKVDLIKMDIKGAAERALKGAVNTLRRDHPRLILSTEEPEDDAAAIVSLVEGFGFDYQMSCGACAVDTDYSVKPVVLFFN